MALTIVVNVMKKYKKSGVRSVMGSSSLAGTSIVPTMFRIKCDKTSDILLSLSVSAGTLIEGCFLVWLPTFFFLLTIFTFILMGAVYE